MDEAESELLDIKAAAELLRVSETSLRRWTNDGRLGCLRVGLKRERRFRRTDLLAFLEDNPARPRAELSPHAAHGSHAAHASPGGEASLAQPHAHAHGEGHLREHAQGHALHLCSIHRTPLARTRRTVEFLADGLRRGEHCHMYATREGGEAVLAELRLRIPDLDRDLAASRLVTSTYRNTGPAQVEHIETMLRASLARGARSMRLCGHVSDSRLARTARFEKVAQYEETFEREVARRFPLMTLCQYDAPMHSGLELVEVLARHGDVFRPPMDSILS